MKQSRFIVIVAAVCMLAGVAAVAGAANRQTAHARAAKAAATAPADISLRKAYGSPQAPITIEVFSDYQCPQCKIFYETTAVQLMQNYVDTGKVYLVHRDFPLNIHSHSTDAARWANAAAIAGVFPQVDQGLYATQDAWAETGNVEGALAGVLTPDEMKKVRAAESTQGPAIEAALAKDKALGDSKRVDGTPTIFVTSHGQTVQLPAGGVSYALFKEYLDHLLQSH